MRAILLSLALMTVLPAIADAQQRAMRAAPEPEDRGIAVCTVRSVDILDDGTTLICDAVSQSDWSADTQAFFAPADPDQYSPNADSVTTIASMAMMRGRELRIFYYNPHVVGTEGCARNPCRRIFRISMR
ncbi:hypothetical protein [Maricaulis sp.]|uniref:hypothetical protein n=1 Tax=Maricaulis sp. TaxID=1486257 RepID=UPI002639594A|nr:hypothetical protein [Maricaulis sp.]